MVYYYIPFPPVQLPPPLPPQCLSHQPDPSSPEQKVLSKEVLSILTLKLPLTTAVAFSSPDNFLIRPTSGSAKELPTRTMMIMKKLDPIPKSWLG